MLRDLTLPSFLTNIITAKVIPRFPCSRTKPPSGRVYLKLTQTAELKPSVTPLFHIPVEIKLIGSAGDTTVRVLSDAPVVYADFDYSRNITAQIDPNQWVLNPGNGQHSAGCHIGHSGTDECSGIRIPQSRQLSS